MTDLKETKAMKGKIICQIYRSARHEGMYLYVERKLEGANELDRVPDALMKQFGRAEKAMMLVIDSEKKFAITTAETVMENIRKDGFHLQLPPQKEKVMAELALKNSKLQLS